MSQSFVFVTCQRGAETALKADLARSRPDWRFAYSRPGFVTFKLPPDVEFREDEPLGSPLARAGGRSLGRVQAPTLEERAKLLWQSIADEPVVAESFDALHVWERDPALPGEHDFQPGVSPAAAEARQAIVAAAPEALRESTLLCGDPHSPAARRVLDCVLVEPDLWWLGCHVAGRRETRWPGGIPPLEIPANMVSRAYLKMAEAVAWSGLPLSRGDRCVELGSAPGGASQYLLEQGLIVLGIDPAEMAEPVASHPNFLHLKMRGADLKRREFRGFRWLMADMNVVPSYTLNTIESIVCHRDVDVRGLLVTLKLRDWSLAAELPAYVERVRGWGFSDVRLRQLAYNRQEVCLAALRGGAVGPMLSAAHTRLAWEKLEN